MADLIEDEDMGFEGVEALYFPDGLNGKMQSCFVEDCDVLENHTCHIYHENGECELVCSDKVLICDNAYMMVD